MRANNVIWNIPLLVLLLFFAGVGVVATFNAILVHIDGVEQRVAQHLEAR